MRLPIALTLLPAVFGPCGGSSSSPAPVGLLDRPAGAVVLTGAELPRLAGLPPQSLVAFRWSEEAGWSQVPVQVDERAVVQWLQVYGGVQPPWETPLSPDDRVLSWCDDNTFTGADPDPTFDTDDELALLTADVGDRAPIDMPLPAGVSASEAVELRLLDELDGGLGWLYVFASDGSLDPAAGVDHVGYGFALAAGVSYAAGYEIVGGPNDEQSFAASPGVWRIGFSDRWVLDELVLEDGVSAPVDVLDRLRLSNGAPACVRTEDTFCGYTTDPSQGAFLANVDGPVRAIRSAVGANSGVLTQRDVVMWPRRIDVSTVVRVHPTVPFETVTDLSQAALGMRYYAPWAKNGITLNGDPGGDPTPPQDAPTWDVVTGPQGTLVVTHAFDFEQPGLLLGTSFADDLAPDPAPCTGDGEAIGAFGVQVQSFLENTDPRLIEEFGVAWTAEINRRFHVEPADLGAKAARAVGAERHDQHTTPVQVEVLPFDPPIGTLVDEPPLAPPTALTVAAAPAGLVAAPLALAVGDRVTWSLVAGRLPNGVTLDPSGVLRGRTLEGGTHRVTLLAANGSGACRVELELELAPEVFGRSPAAWIVGAHEGWRALLEGALY